MLSLLFQIANGQLSEIATLENFPGLTIYNYYKNVCGPCERLLPILEEIDARLDRNGLNLQIKRINCDSIDCTSEDIKAVPSVVVKNGDTTIDQTVGYRTFYEIADFLSKNTEIEREVFNRRIDTTPGKVVQLKEEDFYSGFDGPWLILFYNTKNDFKRELIKDLATEYDGRLNVGEIYYADAEKIKHTINIYTYPTVTAIFNGVSANYTGNDTMKELTSFAEEILDPTLREINLKNFNSKKNSLIKGVPIFIVLYRDIEAVTSRFKTLAHEYKFKAKMFKSSDVEVFSDLGIEVGDKETKLVAFRDGTLHKYSGEIDDKEALSEWVFHAHYPYVTRINNENFYTIFHGMKPAVIMLALGDQMLMEFEIASESIHKGLPFANQIFGYLDVNIYSLFVPNLLPGISIPNIVVYDPNTEKFYTDYKKIASHNIKQRAIEIVKNHERGRLYVYKPPRKIYKYFIVFLGIVGLAVLFIKVYYKKSKKNEFLI